MEINAVDIKFETEIKDKINQKTKPVGSLGQIEDIALQLASIQSNKAGKLISNITINKPVAVIFAGEHGISEERISIAPSCVTRQMVQTFLTGNAAINCFCTANNIDLKIVDAGIVEPITKAYPNLINMRLGAGTKNFVNESAMTDEQVELGLSYGEQVVTPIIENGTNLLIFGEMGIGNTSSATAITSRLIFADVDLCVGVGTGITAEQLFKKKSLIEKALKRFSSNAPLTVLKEVGGFEIVEMTGAILAAAKAGISILVDGFIVSTAALLACRINNNVRDYLIFAHESDEFGHQLLLAHLKAKPLLNLGLRLGEGTGAAIALPLLKSAAAFYNNMASFEDAGVTI
ncbi:nicotinate-nucleotide--dimethylbenzimidazole phosphoribosyltransferase [Pseudocolwellia sp. AS88]|uniref:nicotinate-nucleotide--dimethylbenzimidazole phosphoribosyltransferase n=1 Tax=Pseudocolwellia sp. AS88 TaxID=3063958 RepID=UPI0026EBA603|nr:nicotinate-nucleotide--dimethylbenzimidazole phosphoribosyltransferase [Pseudocolwellia sp. AS88]MDO7085438.1 nicotinate-nucleotide--dimethylbenzimidazole phosphoribosyltransferase [Pseudocolwellia sp. AS88]